MSGNPYGYHVITNIHNLPPQLRKQLLAMEKSQRGIFGEGHIFDIKDDMVISLTLIKSSKTVRLKLRRYVPSMDLVLTEEQTLEIATILINLPAMAYDYIKSLRKLP